MLNDLDAGKRRAVFLACRYTDLRKGIDGLAEIVQEQFEMNPFVGSTLFLFCGRRCDRIKGLLWEGDGFLLLYKRLEDGRFQWPRTEEEVKKITPQQFRWLMEGLTIYQKKVVRNVHPKRIV
ncbi:MAG: IS66 family insertion sequence element accessory protein TnpB [Eubacterium sp.]|nr:IS66 family insertion sequence element accessory protein TnpB [Eubacterium sp.]MCI2197264.1 IS66 family insertion sequence element accessory protein TnpB [Eubacterium sp.]